MSLINLTIQKEESSKSIKSGGETIEEAKKKLNVYLQDSHSKAKLANYVGDDTFSIEIKQDSECILKCDLKGKEELLNKIEEGWQN